MISRYEATMDGIALSSVHPSIYVLSIDYNSPSISYKSSVYGDRDGAILDRRYIEKSSVTIRFMLRVRNPVERHSAMMQVHKWANGTLLKTSDRPGQMLRCVCEKYPVIQSAHNWATELTMTFTAFEIPYWRDVDKTVGIINGGELQQNGTYHAQSSMFVPGDVGEIFCDARLVPKAQCTGFTIGCGTTYIALEGLSIPSGQPINLTYDDKGILHITSNNISLLDKRRSDSADNMMVTCNTLNHIGFDCTVDASASFEVRGCWF